jgi:hypothetical protein
MISLNLHIQKPSLIGYNGGTGRRNIEAKGSPQRQKKKNFIIPINGKCNDISGAYIYISL